MKKLIPAILFVVIANISNAQKKWFTPYTDSVALVNDANEITGIFVSDIQKLTNDSSLRPVAVLNTTPWLIYYSSDGKVNLPLWSQVLPDLKEFTYKITGGKESGETFFGLFFNGFYLPHELGHAFQQKAGKKELSGSYDNEYFANTIAMLWWRKQNKERELEKCYELSKEIVKTLSNILPEGTDIRKYYTDNYYKILADKDNFPYLYGYMQFTQFIKIYEDKTLPGFDEFVREFIAKQ